MPKLKPTNGKSAGLRFQTWDLEETKSMLIIEVWINARLDEGYEIWHHMLDSCRFSVIMMKIKPRRTIRRIKEGPRKFKVTWQHPKPGEETSDQPQDAVAIFEKIDQ